MKKISRVNEDSTLETIVNKHVLAGRSNAKALDEEDNLNDLKQVIKQLTKILDRINKEPKESENDTTN